MINKIIRLITDSKHDTGGVKFLAQEMGIKYSTLYSLYSGKNSNPTIETVGKICEYYNITFSDLSDDAAPPYHFDRLSSDIIPLSEQNNTNIYIKNNTLIDTLPKSSQLIFEKFSPPLKNKNHYICTTLSGEVVLRKVIEEDNKFIFISSNRIIHEDNHPIMQLKNVKI
ncbi:XRE family transcriptional regulator [Vibrio sp. Of14-4]|uniref:helix-turn-helix domain-containing protein n=1 Tax=Vibrio sp. Of14-4 TaxID=2724878 RepID=UPI0023B7B755|nr:XRE family transcriptional regulator [Vibrio sp. Of14-4]